MESVQVKGRDCSAAFASIGIPPPFMIAQGYHRKNPYCTGDVEMEGGARVDARFEGVAADKPEEIKIGMLLKIKYLRKEVGEKNLFGV